MEPKLTECEMALTGKASLYEEAHCGLDWQDEA
jgi:hypothetical protein